MERRRHQRFALQQLVELGFGRERFIHAEGVDISKSGIRCQTSEEIEVSTTLSVYFTLDTESDNPDTLAAEAVVRRCDLLPDGSYDVGLEFSLPGSLADRRLEEFLENQGS